MGRRFIWILVVVSVVVVLAGGAMADMLGGSPQGKQVMISSAAQEFVPEENYAGTNWQTSGPTETVAITLMLSEESWMNEYGND